MCVSPVKVEKRNNLGTRLGNDLVEWFELSTMCNWSIGELAPIVEFHTGRAWVQDLWRKKAKKTNDPPIRTLNDPAYKNFKREVKREIRLAEKELVADQI